MKVLSVKNPWASHILLAKKHLEVRSWSTRYRGKLGIHISKTRDTLGVDPDYLHRKLDGEAELPEGTLAGEVELVDVRPMRPEDAYDGGSLNTYREGAFVWVVADPVVYEEPIPMRGSLGLWEYPAQEHRGNVGIPATEATP